jgi:hypothetical protein
MAGVALAHLPTPAPFTGAEATQPTQMGSPMQPGPPMQSMQPGLQSMQPMPPAAMPAPMDTMMQPSGPSGPIPPGAYATPPPGMFQPVPGAVQPVPAAGTYAPWQPLQGSKLKWVAVAGVLAVAAVAAVFVILGSRSENETTEEGLPANTGTASDPSAAAEASKESADTPPDTATQRAPDKEPGSEGDKEAATPVAPEATTVTFVIGSSPQGADIFIDDANVRTGTTPMTLTLPKGDGIVQIRLVKSGFGERKGKYPLSGNQTVELLLPEIKADRDSRRDRRRERTKSKDEGFEIIRDPKTPKKPAKPPDDEGFGTVN